MVIVPFLLLVATNPPTAADFDRWVTESSRFDCPMSAEEVQAVDLPAQDSRRQMVAALACACGVVTRGASVARQPGCNTAAAVSRFQRAIADAQQQQMRDAARAAARAGKKPVSLTATLTPAEQALVDWGMRLAKKDKAPFEAITRAKPISGAAAVTALPEEDGTRTFAEVKKVARRFDESYRGKAWSVLERFHHSIEVALQAHEKKTLKGQQSAAGRAMLADATAKLQQAKKQIAIAKKLESNPKYKALWARREKAQDAAATYFETHGIAANQGCSTKGPGSKACKLEREVDQLDDQIAAMESAAGVDAQ